MRSELVRLVRARAGNRCEYCLLPQAALPLPFQIDHVVAEQHGGPTTEANLALACPFCNRHKGPNLAGIDGATGEMVRLFHPRMDEWSEHSEEAAGVVCGRTAVGRVTVQVLRMNTPDLVALRRQVAEEGRGGQ